MLCLFILQLFPSSSCSLPHAAGTYTIFSTHLQRLTELSSLYNEVKSLYLITVPKDDKLSFRYELSEGVSPIAHYGLKLAAMVRASGSDLPVTFPSNNMPFVSHLVSSFTGWIPQGYHQVRLWYHWTSPRDWAGSALTEFLYRLHIVQVTSVDLRTDYSHFYAKRADSKRVS